MQTRQTANVLKDFILNLLSFIRDADAIGDINLDADADRMVLLILIDVDPFDAIKTVAEEAVEEISFESLNAVDIAERLEDDGLKDLALDVSNKNSFGELKLLRVNLF